jgi:GAF domain-containing protein
VATETNQVIPDVTALDNYLACSNHTRSEIVVLVRTPTGEIVGQFDADSDLPAAFDETDEALLLDLAATLGNVVRNLRV